MNAELNAGGQGGQKNACRKLESESRWDLDEKDCRKIENNDMNDLIKYFKVDLLD